MIALDARRRFTLSAAVIVVFGCGSSGNGADGMDAASDAGADRVTGGMDAVTDHVPPAAEGGHDGNASSDASGDGTLAVFDLQGAWYADLASSDGGSPVHERLRFTGANYFYVFSNPSPQYCAEAGTFNLSDGRLILSPTGMAGFQCTAPMARSEAITSTASGVTIEEPLGTAAYRRAPSVPKVFVTVETHDGNLAGDTALTGATAMDKADALCNSSLAKPDDATYKALLANGSTRTVRPALDWVLAPDTTYFQAQGVVNVFTTDPAAIYVVTNNEVVPDFSQYAWSGLGVDLGATVTCNSWTTTISGVDGWLISTGQPDNLGSNISGVCGDQYPFLCVRVIQPNENPVPDGGASDAGPSPLEGSWVSPTPTPTVPGATMRLKFTGNQYVWLQDNGTKYCGEVGVFSAGATSVHLRPSRLDGFGPCTIGPDRIEALTHDATGITLSYAGKAAHFTPAAMVPKLFVPYDVHDGDFSDDVTLPGATIAAKADAFCVRSSAKPDERTYKAVLVDGVSRSATPPIDWVLAANTIYYDAAGLSPRLTTDASLRVTVNHSPLANSFPYPGLWFQWTGLDSAFMATSANCQGWTSSASTVRGTAVEAWLNASFSSTVDYDCSTIEGDVVCVSQ